MHRKGALPTRQRDVILKYSRENDAYVEEIGARSDLVVAVVREGDRVIGFASAELQGEEAEINLVAVDEFSRRERGVQRTLKVADETFSVGIGHAVVDLLMSALPGRIVTDATSDQSRYIFKSFGFSQQPGSSNPCVLQLER